MKKAAWLPFVALLFTACHQPNDILKQRIVNADSMAINYFRGDGTMDTVVTVKIIKDPQQIEKMVALVSGHAVEKELNCGYDGSLHFFKMNQVVQDIDFRMNAADCMYFTFKQNGKMQATGLTGEAKALLESLKADK